MSRRVSLPGADELFRTTGGMGLQSSSPAPARRPAGGEPATRVPSPAGESDTAAAEAPDAGPRTGTGPDGAEHAGREAAGTEPPGTRRTAAQERAAARQPQDAAPVHGQGGQPARRRGRPAARRPSGRERHDEKITVYVSAEELMDLEHARLVLRGEHGLAVDRGRIVREAVAVVLADLESRGDASILVRRLRGR
ncbi:hypothetical protein IHE55_04830 [Streptomyces pactum]|uniref:Cobyrinic acid a,c-diamide synthase n=1 Tax=Streptomyces pactum TaxID=68249 RepID=A0ABS0NG47_9ACTN|nr:hypothetical protein [Streptomyces pactum]MBH5334163.1 hypothetical protein [Streptomyces pactum]